jgi:hypothetical protein
MIIGKPDSTAPGRSLLLKRVATRVSNKSGTFVGLSQYAEDQPDAVLCVQVFLPTGTLKTADDAAAWEEAMTEMVHLAQRIIAKGEE